MSPKPSRRRQLGLATVLATGLTLTAACTARGPAPEPELARQRGNNAVDQDRHDWARIYFEQDLELHPDRPETLRKLARAWNSGYQRSLSESTAVLERYLEVRPDDTEMRIQQVRLALLIGQWEQARDGVARLGESTEADLARAELYLELEPEKASTVIDRLLRTAPLDSRTQALAARNHQRDGNLEAALASARQAVRLDPLDFQSWYLIGRLERKLGHREKALVALKRHQQLRRLAEDGSMADVSPAEKLATLEEIEPEVAPPARFRFYRRKVALLLAVGKKSEAADLVENLMVDPKATLTDRLLLAKQAEESGRRSLSRRLFEEILAAHPDHRGALASVVLLLLDAGETATASQLLTEGLAQHPSSARLHFLRGRLALIEDRPTEAEANYLAALHLAPWEHGWRLAYADLLRAQGRTEELVALLDEAPEPHPSLKTYRQRHSASFGER